MPFTYLLECADGTYYAGWTTDVARRLQAHNAGRGGRYTRGRRPVRMVYVEEHETQVEAQRREAALRRLSRAEKAALIASQRGEVC